jgi:hypothetical protein
VLSCQNADASKAQCYFNKKAKQQHQQLGLIEVEHFLVQPWKRQQLQMSGITTAIGSNLDTYLCCCCSIAKPLKPVIS